MDYMEKLLEFSQIINSSLDIEVVRKKIIEAIVELLEAEAGSLLLYDRKTDELYFNVAVGDKAEKIKSIRLKMGVGIAGWVAKHRKPQLINDVQNDPRFFKNADKKSGFTTRNMVCVPIIRNQQLLGVMQAINKKDGEFKQKDLDVLIALSNQVAVSIENAMLYKELKDTFYEVVFALAEAIEKRDPYTGGHTKRVMEYSILIANQMGLDKDFIEKLKLSAILHDVGKIGVPDRVLLKQDKLDDEEYKIIKGHPKVGADILRKVKKLKEIIAGVELHHERFDGKGYPYGLKGKEIPLSARIIAVADTYDAMTTTRPYRKGLSKDAAIEEIVKNKGKQFDPEIVDAFVEAMENE